MKGTAEERSRQRGYRLDGRGWQQVDPPGLATVYAYRELAPTDFLFKNPYTRKPEALSAFRLGR